MASDTEVTWSTVWRAVCGGLICYTSAGLVSVAVAATAALAIDAPYLVEIGAGFAGGLVGAIAGVWAVDRILEHYPARVIGWTYIGVGSAWWLVLAASPVLTAAGLGSRSGSASSFTIGDAFYAAIFLGQAAIFYYALVQGHFTQKHDLAE